MDDAQPEPTLLSHSFWRRHSPSFPGIPEYMEIMPEAKRIVSAVVVKENPLRYAPIAVTYEDLAPGLIRTRLRPDSSWHHDPYRIEGNTIHWSDSGKEWPWDSITEDDMPVWFHAFQTKTQERMDDRETAAGGRTTPRESL